MKYLFILLALTILITGCAQSISSDDDVWADAPKAESIPKNTTLNVTEEVNITYDNQANVIVNETVNVTETINITHTNQTLNNSETVNISTNNTETVCVPDRIIGENEVCDALADPNGCDEGFMCVDCVCLSTCDDGIISEGEMCDPSASPTGCSFNETCSSDCTCTAKEHYLSIKILNPSNNEEVTEEDTVLVSINASEYIKKVNFFFNHTSIGVDRDPPYTATIDASSYPNKNYLLSARVYDIFDNIAEDNVTVKINVE